MVGSSIPGAITDPFPAPPLTEGTWAMIGAGHRLIYIGQDRVLDWVPATGEYVVWEVDRAAAAGTDPLLAPVCSGKWTTIVSGHELVYLGGNRLLDWQPVERRFRVWLIDRNATGSADPLPGVPQTNGLWSTITLGHQLISLGGDRVLDWDLGIGGFRVFRHDPTAVGAADPLPGPPLAQGTWGSIRAAGHRLIPLGPDRVLDWEPVTGAYRVLRHDRTATGDPFHGDPEVAGQWVTVRQGHELVYLDGDRVLDWEPATGHFRLWPYDRAITTLHRTTVRFHLKIFTKPEMLTVDELVANARALFASCGIDLVEVSREIMGAADGTPLAGFQVLQVGNCSGPGSLTSHQTDLFELRGGAGPGDIVVYIVRDLMQICRGCSVHPPDRPGAVISAKRATEWTLAHEIGHVLGLEHPLEEGPERLMNRWGHDGITRPPPDLLTDEVTTIIASPLSQE